MSRGRIGKEVGVETFTAAVEGSRALDRAARAVAPRVAPLGRGTARRVLSGEWQGHALHPLLTDVPIGFWTTSFVLDLVGGRASRAASQRCIGLGLLAVPVTALAGWSDWVSEVGERADDAAAVRRTGAAHAALNAGAAAAYAASWQARRRDRHATGVAWGLVGATVASLAGHLGGHLAYRLGVGSGRPSAEGPSDGSSNEEE
jgi:uncharacterized membrane protein